MDQNVIKMSRPQWLRSWFAHLLKVSQFSVSSLPLSASRDWTETGDAIRHHSGLFFAVVGVRWANPSGRRIEQPLIEQTEIGTLGFLIKGRGRQRQILVQAKIEPGNVGAVQLDRKSVV